MVHTSRVVSTYTLRNVKEEELVALILNNIKELSEYVKEIQKTSRHITSLNQVEAFRHEIAIIIKIRQVCFSSSPFMKITIHRRLQRNSPAKQTILH